MTLRDLEGLQVPNNWCHTSTKCPLTQLEAFWVPNRYLWKLQYHPYSMLKNFCLKLRAHWVDTVGMVVTAITSFLRGCARTDLGFPLFRRCCALSSIRLPPKQKSVCERICWKMDVGEESALVSAFLIEEDILDQSGGSAVMEMSHSL